MHPVGLALFAYLIKRLLLVSEQASGYVGYLNNLFSLYGFKCLAYLPRSMRIYIYVGLRSLVLNKKEKLVRP